MSENIPQNWQAGVPLGPSDAAEDGRVATGDRREEVHFEPDADHLVKASHLVRPAALAPDEHSPAQERGEVAGPPAVEDVLVAPPAPSVWDARPPADDAAGNPDRH